jgi:hypothetical protein
MGVRVEMHDDESLVYLVRDRFAPTSGPGRR